MRLLGIAFRRFAFWLASSAFTKCSIDKESSDNETLYFSLMRENVELAAAFNRVNSSSASNKSIELISGPRRFKRLRY